MLEGLSEAVFKDYGKLRIEVRKGDYGIYVKGWGNGGKPVVTAEVVIDHREYEGDEPRKIPSRTVAGNLVEGNPFDVEDERCGTEPYRRSRFRVGTAVIDTEQCLGPILAGASSMRFLTVKVHDENPALGNPFDATFEGATLAAALKTRFYHHGGCTYFALDAGRARYAMRNTAVGAGCAPSEIPALVREPGRAGSMLADYGNGKMVIEPLEFHFWPESQQWYRPAKIVFKKATSVSRSYFNGAPEQNCEIPANTEIVADGAGPRDEYGSDSLAILFKAGSIPSCPGLKAVEVDKSDVVVNPVAEAPL